MYGAYNPQLNIDRINNQIKELENIKRNYQTQPPMNVFNVGTQQVDFEAKFLNKDEDPTNIIVTRKTAFISLDNKLLTIKETDGTTTQYEIVLPLDEKDKKIIELERRLSEYEHQLSTTNEYSEPAKKNERPNESDELKSKASNE